MWLRYAPWRVSCGRCGVRVEQVSWAAHGSTFTAPLEEMAAYLAQVTERATATRLVGISWPAVGGIVERVVARRLDATRLARLRRVGVDEFSYRKRHHYLSVVVDHDRRRVVWAGPGRKAERLEQFFDRLGPAGCARIELVTADLAASYDKPLRARVPQARVVYDDERDGRGDQHQAPGHRAARPRVSLARPAHLDALSLLWRHRTDSTPTHTTSRRLSCRRVEQRHPYYTR